MKIFIDESGNFAAGADKSSISLVASLTFSEIGYRYFQRKYVDLRNRLPKTNGEVKGRLLGEIDVDRIVGLLINSGAILEIVAIDSLYNTEIDVRRHIAGQALELTKNISEHHHPNVVEKVNDLRAFLEALSPQLYLQSLAMIELIHVTLRNAIVYFSFRKPEELGRFDWTIDAKGDRGPTNWEKWWKDILLPVFQSRSLRDPLWRVEGGNYRFLDRFSTEFPEYLLSHYSPKRNSDYFDPRPVLTEYLEFRIDTCAGLEAVDVLANAVKRMLSGNLQHRGYGRISKLCIHRSFQYIKLLTISESDIDMQPEYMQVLQSFSRAGRSMMK